MDAGVYLDEQRTKKSNWRGGATMGVKPEGRYEFRTLRLFSVEKSGVRNLGHGRLVIIQLAPGKSVGFYISDHLKDTVASEKWAQYCGLDLEEINQELLRDMDLSGEKPQ